MTLFVDSSLSGDGRAGGWGSWAICDGWGRGRFDGGPIELKDGAIGDSTTAELAGIGYALWNLRKRGELEGVGSIMIQCDSVGALSLIKQKIERTTIVKSGSVHIGKSTSKHTSVPVILEVIADILEGRAVQIKHVKGHQGGRDGRSWVNEQCDTAAKKHMKRMRRILEREMPKGVAEDVSQ